MKGSFFCPIIELIDDFRLNQQILNRWYSFMVNEFEIVEVEDVLEKQVKFL